MELGSGIFAGSTTNFEKGLLVCWDITIIIKINFQNICFHSEIHQFMIRQSHYHLNAFIKTYNHNFLSTTPSLCCPATSLINNNYFTYIKQKELHLIQAKYGDTKFEKLKMATAVVRHIFFEGAKDAKTDIQNYFSLQRKQQQLTHQEKHFKQRMKNQFEKMKLIGVIQIMPFSGPLFLAYLYTYPGSIPSWFSIDSLHDQNQFNKIQKQKQAIEYFKKSNINENNLNIYQLNVVELRLLSELLFGYYRDGTVGLHRIQKKDQLPYFLHEEVSKKILIRKIKRKLKLDVFHSQLYDMKTFEEQVKLKFMQVMSGKNLMVHQPLHQVEQDPVKQQTLTNQGNKQK